METEIAYQTPLLKLTEYSHPIPKHYYVVRYPIGESHPLRAEYLLTDGTWAKNSPSYWGSLKKVIAVLAEFEIDVM